MAGEKLTREQASELISRYDAKFGNAGEFTHPQVLFDQRFYDLLQKALQTGKLVDQSAVDAVIPNISWEW